MRNLIPLFFFVFAEVALASPPAQATKPQAPTSPTEFLAVKSLNIPGAVELSWHAVKGVSEYTISSSRETPDNWHDLGTTSETRYQVNELPEGTKYYFRIASNVRSGQSKWSGAVVQYSSQTKDFRPVLLLPANFRVGNGSVIARSAVPSHKGELALAWNAVAGARSYVVQICEAKECGVTRSEGGEYSRFNQDDLFRDLTTVIGTEHVVTSLLSGKVYFFRIMGIDDKGQRGDRSLVKGHRAP